MTLWYFPNGIISVIFFSPKDIHIYTDTRRKWDKNFRLHIFNKDHQTGAIKVAEVTGLGGIGQEYTARSFSRLVNTRMFMN